MSDKMDEPPTEINVLTLNVWGLKYISKVRTERLAEIGRQLALADPQPHIVALQECFVQEDFQSIRRETRGILPYGKYYNSAVFGGGLAILSRWPIEESTMFKYPLNGRPQAFWRGDWFVGKGVAHARIRFGPGRKDIVEVFNTHVSKPDDLPFALSILLRPTSSTLICYSNPAFPDLEPRPMLPTRRQTPTTRTCATASHSRGR